MKKKNLKLKRIIKEELYTVNEVEGQVKGLEKLRIWFIGEMEEGLAYQKTREIFDTLIEEMTEEEARAIATAKSVQNK